MQFWMHNVLSNMGLCVIISKSENTRQRSSKGKKEQEKAKQPHIGGHFTSASVHKKEPSLWVSIVTGISKGAIYQSRVPLTSWIVNLEFSWDVKPFRVTLICLSCKHCTSTSAVEKDHRWGGGCPEVQTHIEQPWFVDSNRLRLIINMCYPSPQICCYGSRRTHPTPSLQPQQDSSTTSITQDRYYVEAQTGSQVSS